MNNYTHDDTIEVAHAYENGIKYMVYGKEVGESGTPHLQGYVHFTSKVVRPVKWFKGRAHWEVAKASGQKNYEYCTKDGDFVEFGTLTTQGKRTDLQRTRDLMDEGLTNAEIIRESTSWQAVNGVAKLRLALIEPRGHDEKPEVYWFWGSTGTGKTLTAKKMCDYDYDVVEWNNGFLNGYTGKKNVLFDDFRGGIPFNKLLTMLDYGKCIVNVKGGESFFGAMRIFFTSSKSPEDCYNLEDDRIDQLIRRIDETRWFDSRASGPEVGGNTGPEPDDPRHRNEISF